MLFAAIIAIAALVIISASFVVLRRGRNEGLTIDPPDLTDVVDISDVVPGLEVGDLIISVNGNAVSTMEELAADFKFFRPGEEVEVEVLRDGGRVQVQVTVGSN